MLNTLKSLQRSLTSYKILKRIGRGSYGTVFLVKDTRSDAYHCLKQIVLDAGAGVAADARAAAELEVATLRQLDHPSVVSYHEHFMVPDPMGDSLCLVMGYCEGGDLSQQIKQHHKSEIHFSEAQVLEWFVQLAMGLQYVHGHQILHRDLKSQNVFLSGGTVKLGDFGIVKVLDGSITSAQTFVGTPYYLSPEVCRSEKYSYASDVWALGCILFEMCALQRAWSGDAILVVINQIVNKEPPAICAAYSAPLKALVSTMLSKDSTARPSLPGVLALPVIRAHIEAGASADAIASAPPVAAAAPAAAAETAAGGGCEAPADSQRGEEEMAQRAVAPTSGTSTCRNKRKGVKKRPPAAAAAAPRGNGVRGYHRSTPVGSKGSAAQPKASKAAAAESKREPNGTAPTATGALSGLLARGEHEAQRQAAASAAESSLQRQRSLKQEWQSVVQGPPVPEPIASSDTRAPRSGSSQEDDLQGAGQTLAAQFMRKRCEDAVGEHFAAVYALLKKAHATSMPSAQVQKGLKAIVGRSKLGSCMLVEQLIFLERVQE